ncbi:protein phosphatase 2C [Nitzschia inconspicua]|uniref:Protein phosphatase 2C n=1 Tax=Nitzschia inconspicua TaxID=303405 RepID=A0A9K3L1A8_9STRA|nr:protein phosphatase 2C [Nitzschia inconspicua]
MQSEDPIKAACVEKAGIIVVDLNAPNRTLSTIGLLGSRPWEHNVGGSCLRHGYFHFKCDKAKKKNGPAEEEEQVVMDLPPEEQLITGVSDVAIHKRQTNTFCYLVLACDGIWDVTSNGNLGDSVKKEVKIKNDQNVSEALLTEVGDATRDHRTTTCPPP